MIALQRRQDLALDIFPHRRIAKKAGDPDEQLPQQQLNFFGGFPHIAQVVVNAVQLVQAHASLDTPHDGVLFVGRKIVAGVGAQQDEDLVKETSRSALKFGLDLGLDVAHEPDAPDKRDDLGRQFIGGRHGVHHICVNRAARHAVKLGRGRRLRKSGAAGLPNRTQAQRAIRAHARQNDANAVVLPVIGERLEEKINRLAQATRFGRLKQMQHTMHQGQVPAGRNHIDVVGFDGHLVCRLLHRHRRTALQQLHQHALAVRIPVLHHHDGQPGPRRHMR